MTVMPVTFPDGSTAELVYPPELELERGLLTPEFFIEGGPHSCSNVLTSRGNMADDVYDGDRPIATFEDARGNPVGLWRGRGWAAPYSYLVVRLDSWVLAVICNPEDRYVAPDRFGPPLLPPFAEEEVAVWARGIDGRETPDGMLVMTPREPLRLGEWAFNTGPTLRLSFPGEDPAVVDIGLEGCDPGVRLDPDGKGEVAQWCVSPGIRIYALGTEESLDALVAGLQIRNFERLLAD